MGPVGNRNAVTKITTNSPMIAPEAPTPENGRRVEEQRGIGPPDPQRANRSATQREPRTCSKRMPVTNRARQLPAK